MKIIVGGIIGAVIAFVLSYLSYLFELKVAPPRGNFIFNYSALGAVFFSICFAFLGLLLGCIIGRGNLNVSENLFVSFFFAIIAVLPFVFSVPEIQSAQNNFDWHALGEYLFSLVRPLILFPVLALMTNYLLKLLFKTTSLS